MYLIVSTSLNPESRSRILARAAVERFEHRELPHEFVDLRERSLPQCDGDSCYSDPGVVEMREKIESADGILIAMPVYNYNAASTAKNLVELTGKAWTDKVAGFICAAGGAGSYMSVMGLANSLMLDFRTLIIPRFVYATENAFRGDELADDTIQDRIEELVEMLNRIAVAMK